MPPLTSNLLRSLSGRLKSGGIGARGIEHIARNPGCKRLLAISSAGVKPRHVSKEVYGVDPEEQQSPFAIQTGKAFEKRLYADNGKLLVERYQRAGLLPSIAQVAVIPELIPADMPDAMTKRRDLTLQYLTMKRRGDPQAPHLIIHPRLAVDLAGVEHIIEPDALAASDSDAFYRPVEIKSYPDRGGKTDQSDLRNARRQLAVGVVGLEHELAGLPGSVSSGLILDEGDLILRKIGRWDITLTPQVSLASEVFSLKQMLHDAPGQLQSLLQQLPPGATLDDPTVLNSIPSAWKESCREHCALAKVCKKQAAQCQDAMLLGSKAREELRAAGGVSRALQLMRGHGALPTTPEESELQSRLQGALRELQEAVGHVL